MRAAKALLRQNIKVVEEDGEYSAQVETDAGTYDIDRYVNAWLLGRGASDAGATSTSARMSGCGPLLNN